MLKKLLSIGQSAKEKISKKQTSKGQQKEQQAQAWLKQQQIEIIAQNFHCKGGEIDLIGLSTVDSKEPTLIFFEVKYRKNSDYGHPSEFVTPVKQQRIILCAQNFLLKHPEYTDYAMRFDVIGFAGEQKSPDWIQDAFGV